MQCNFHCPNCQFKDSSLNRSKVWDELYIYSVIDIIENKMPTVTTASILGGEPSLWPHLPTLVDKLHGIGVKVQTVSNGTGSPEVYGASDVIRITDYGASNKWLYWNLRKKLGRRVHFLPGVHIPMDIPWTEKVQCSCWGWMFVGNMVYQCGEQARLDINGVCTDNGFNPVLIADPTKQECCHTCPSNKAAYNRVAPPIMAQFSIWGVEEANFIFRLPIPRSARRLYSLLRRLRGR